MSGLEAVIGLEVHVQLATRTKLFCGDPAEFGSEPNTRVCPVCLGLPGALPVVNRAAVELAVRAALGLNCRVHETSIFARKNYFYPDLPKGYQITQHEHPLATGGWLEPEIDAGERRVRIRRVHLEEDAGRSSHDRIAGRTAVDLNRAGVPLIEIVTEPDLRSPEEARGFLTHLKRTLMYMGVSDCDMEKGSLRVDANLSVRPAGEGRLGTRTEVKNLNSFGNVERALGFEADRQRALIAGGGVVARETLLWDADAAEARTMRARGEDDDYRYFPEPDLPPLVLPPDLVDAARAALPEMPAARARRFREVLGLPAYDASVLTSSRDLADYFEATAAAAGDPKAASNWIMTDVLSWLNERDAPGGHFPVSPEALAELIAVVGEGALSRGMGRRVLDRMAETGRPAREIVEAEGLTQVSDSVRLGRWVEEVIAAHPDQARRFREGEEKLMGFFIGQVMQKSGGRADPRKLADVLRERL
ncbi:MAG: Asp-tRNA(Asn)/Glu-tRNA(Gln) amidotransferase subunit GatB [Gemmatimonadetes bacterium]|nr:Asp-tRNA(Asn)/Glu-tRNA(Gln) amidotransferase subunit GatB [Gemmatimonadota bacterium]